MNPDDFIEGDIRQPDRSHFDRLVDPSIDNSEYDEEFERALIASLQDIPQNIELEIKAERLLNESNKRAFEKEMLEREIALISREQGEIIRNLEITERTKNITDLRKILSRLPITNELKHAIYNINLYVNEGIDISLETYNFLCSLKINRRVLDKISELVIFEDDGYEYNES
jgi:hypothetical protein